MTDALVANAIIVVGAFLLYSLMLEGKTNKGSWSWSVIIGGGFGAMAVLSMLFPFQVRPGILSDAKFTIAVLSTAYGGPLAGIITVIIAMAFRGTIGGIGFYVTIPVLLASWLLGLWFFRWSSPMQSRWRRLGDFLLLGYAVCALQLLGLSVFIFFVEWKEVRRLMLDFSVPMVLIFPPMTVLMGLSLDFIDSRHSISQLQKKTANDLEKRNHEMKVLNDVFHHELRTPVVSLQGFMADLRENVQTKNYDGIVNDVRYLQNATDRISIMLEALVRLNRAGITFSKHPSSRFTEVVGKQCSLRPNLRRGVIEDVEIAIDEKPLMNALDAVIDNAFTFSASNPTPEVVLSSSLENQGIAIVVSDNGIGIPPQYLLRVFRLFEKLDANSPGIGVGLTIAERIVKNYGGKIRAESSGEANKGCQIIIWLPLDGKHPV